MLRPYKAVALACTLVALAPLHAAAQDGWLGRVGGMISGKPGTGPLTQREADTGVRTMLNIGVEVAAARLGVVDGFFGDPQVKLPLPGSLASTQKRLAAFGMSGPLDELQLAMNRAAESSMPTVKKLALDAVSGMTISDGLGIVRGGDTAGTTFLRSKTEAKLKELLRPQVEKALISTGAFKALDKLAGSAMTRSLARDARKDVIEFTLTRTLDATFMVVGEQEKAVRADPGKYGVAILKRVFGAGA
jgi:hypothetical protein